MFKRILHTVAAFCVLSGAVAFSTAAPASASTDGIAPTIHLAFTPFLAQVTPPTTTTTTGVIPGAADPALAGKGFTTGLQYLTGLFTGGPARFVIILAIIGTCIGLLQRPDHTELIGNLVKIIIIGVVIITAQTIVSGALFGGV